MPQKHKTTQDEQQVAGILRDIFDKSYLDRVKFDRGLRKQLSTRLNRMARSAGSPICTKKSETYLTLAARRGEVYVGGLEYFERHVREMWGGRATPSSASAPVKGTPDERAEAEKKLVSDFAAWGASEAEDAASSQQLGAVIAGSDGWARYGIRDGDILHFTLDGDAESGEVAIVSYYEDGGEGERKHTWCFAFLVIEGGRFCVRGDSPLECDGEHFAPSELTIVGRVITVTRRGLPVRLKGLELRGLPFADDLPSAEEGDD